jgi:hypothetical protein
MTTLIERSRTIDGEEGVGSGTPGGWIRSEQVYQRVFEGIKTESPARGS